MSSNDFLWFANEYMKYTLNWGGRYEFIDDDLCLVICGEDLELVSKISSFLLICVWTCAKFNGIFCSRSDHIWDKTSNKADISKPNLTESYVDSGLLTISTYLSLYFLNTLSTEDNSIFEIEKNSRHALNVDDQIEINKTWRKKKLY